MKNSTLVAEQAHIKVETLTNEQLLLDKELNDATKAGASNQAVDAIERLQKQKQREVIHAKQLAENADKAVIDAIELDKAEARNIAALNIERAETDFKNTLAVFRAAEAAYIEAAKKLGLADPSNPCDAAWSAAKGKKLRFTPSRFPVPNTEIINAFRSATLTVEFLNRRSSGI